jgi:glycosyltransferase involved in cell wall biosynthesis
MKRLLYIGFDFHQKTKSADFMIHLLRERYEVELYWVNISETNPYSDIRKHAGDYDLLLCWQTMPPVKLLKQFINYKRAVFIPMADACPNIRDIVSWYPYRNFQIISFAKALHDKLISAGFSSHYFQYFPAAQPVDDLGDPSSAFFWTRGNKITCETVEKLSDSSFIKKVHIHNAPDPKVSPLPPPEDSALSYTFSTWFEDKHELNRLIAKSACYIAPRIREGIGMSFLEAMAMGRCVIAPNNFTMNEYIQHGVNGLLYDIKDPAPLEQVDIRKIQQNAFETIRSGHEQWSVKKYELLDLLEEAPKIDFLKIASRRLRKFFHRRG